MQSATNQSGTDVHKNSTKAYLALTIRWKPMTLTISPISTSAYSVHTPLAEPIENPASPLNRKKRGVADHNKTWPQHSVLKISLLNMTQEQKNLTKHNINKWTPHTNLYFKFIDGPNGDIRITANNDTSAAWSRVGTDARNIPVSEPTMSVGFANSSAAIAAKIQHEFGHALGLRHEHKHPDRTLNLHKENIYKEYESRSKTKRQANHDIIHKFQRNEVIISAYDEKSIMHYGFSASALRDEKSIPGNIQLSEGDKRFIQSLYPMDSSPLGKLLNTAIKVLIKS
ncbi:hypothetical protein GNF76_02560 [Pseudomonas sp. CCM 7893]|uniref:Peptidase metallopeptidase domain-containing protein n=1 Tax=Pseudomonas spelaei TaxID=1055469 RepID=A0A6I3W7C1_9PSED|nr:M12 family metallopeptidase [Pseudomonas spelaei]MUF03199.1 hypothetical protein [Pseudomonas spelaei]